jgi:hypothetical protein
MRPIVYFILFYFKLVFGFVNSKRDREKFCFGVRSIDVRVRGVLPEPSENKFLSHSSSLPRVKFPSSFAIHKTVLSVRLFLFLKTIIPQKLRA